MARAFFVIQGASDFLHWLDARLSAAKDSAAENGAPMQIHSVDDADGDGFKDFVEWAIGLNAASKDDHSGVRSHLIEREGKKHLALSFKRRTDSPEIRYIVDISRDFRVWEDATDKMELAETVSAGEGLESITMCLQDSIDATSVQFIRLRVEEVR